jgi:hypothetical protein
MNVSILVRYRSPSHSILVVASLVAVIQLDLLVDGWNHIHTTILPFLYCMILIYEIPLVLRRCWPMSWRTWMNVDVELNWFISAGSATLDTALPQMVLSGLVRTPLSSILSIASVLSVLIILSLTPSCFSGALHNRQHSVDWSVTSCYFGLRQSSSCHLLTFSRKRILFLSS